MINEYFSLLYKKMRIYKLVALKGDRYFWRKTDKLISSSLVIVWVFKDVFTPLTRLVGGKYR